MTIVKELDADTEGDEELKPLPRVEPPAAKSLSVDEAIWILAMAAGTFGGALVLYLWGAPLVVVALGVVFGIGPAAH